MRNLSSIRTLITLFIPLLILLNIPHVHGQSASMGSSFVLTDSEAIAGDIIALDTEGNFVRANSLTSRQVVGVLSNSIDILYEEVEGEGSPIVSSGDTQVNVTTINGDISPGDFIIPSSIPGKGQKATNQDGFVIGIARTAFTQQDGETITVDNQSVQSGSVRVTVQLRPLGASRIGVITNLINQVSNLLFASAQTPEQAETLFRYLAAAIIGATAIAISFRAFGGSLSHGIEALGRNPLAKRQIQTAILINASLILIISIAGIILSFAIIRF